MTRIVLFVLVALTAPLSAQADVLDPVRLAQITCEEVCLSDASGESQDLPQEVQECVVWTCQEACKSPDILTMTRADGEELGARLMTRCLISRGLI